MKDVKKGLCSSITTLLSKAKKVEKEPNLLWLGHKMRQTMYLLIVDGLSI